MATNAPQAPATDPPDLSDPDLEDADLGEDEIDHIDLPEGLLGDRDQAPEGDRDPDEANTVLHGGIRQAVAAVSATGPDPNIAVELRSIGTRIGQLNTDRDLAAAVQQVVAKLDAIAAALKPPPSAIRWRRAAVLLFLAFDQEGRFTSSTKEGKWFYPNYQTVEAIALGNVATFVSWMKQRYNAIVDGERSTLMKNIKEPDLRAVHQTAVSLHKHLPGGSLSTMPHSGSPASETSPVGNQTPP